MNNPKTSTRFTITLPAAVAKRLKDANNQSALIAESLRLKFLQEDKQKLQEKLAEGYKARAKQDAQLTKDFKATNSDGL